MSLARKIRGFYAVIDEADGTAEGQRLVAKRLLEAGACAIQLRMKQASTAELLAAARILLPVATAARSPFIVNDRVDVALAVGADGVHLGQDDLPLDAARQLAPELLIGISTHDLAQVEAAVRGGADYLGYGPVYATATKEDPDPVQGLAALAAAVQRAGAVPIVAIGGITPERAAEVAATGAAAACAIGAVNRAPQLDAAARLIASAWSVR